MMAAPKAPPSCGLPGSIGIHLPAFKRKRIEQWCEEVAQYLRAGSLCRSVIGHTPEDSSRLPGPAVKSAPAGGSHHQQRTGLHISAIPVTAVAATTTTTTTNTNIAGVTTTSMGTVTEMLSFNNNHHKNNNNNNAGFAGNGGGVSGGTKVDSAPPPGRGTPMPDTSGPLPVVKFSYSHYNEQRRRVDRLVQGLPALAAVASSPNPGLDRLGGGGGTNSGAVMLVSGEEPVKTAGTVGSKADRAGRTAGRASPAPAPAQPARPNSRSSSGEPRQRSLPPQLSRHQSVSPTPNRNHHHHHSTTPHGGGKGNSGGKPQSSEIVVIEDDLPGDQNRHGEGFMGSGLRSVRLNGLKRSQSLKVQKARQRMLAGTRRSGEQNTHTHVPVQSCWTLAELTW